jgi:catechol 2,3-dioxygenase-like lactoylglutathione lyase family enzyme
MAQRSDEVERTVGWQTPSMEQRLSLITLAVADLDRSRAFYVDGLGWEPIFAGDDVLMLPIADRLILSLWSLDGFTAEIGEAPAAGAAPITLAHNVATPAEVDAVLAEVAALGAPVSIGRHRGWGGYSGYFSDPDGFRWEVAVNPGVTGAFVLPQVPSTTTPQD